MTLLRFAFAFTALALMSTLAAPSVADETKDAEAVFTEEFLNDPEVLAKGKEIWEEQCQFCHGKNAYPGKAPRLKPRKYTPEFVYGRVTKGFKGMPSWSEVYNQQERMSVAAWVKSKDFSN